MFGLSFSEILVILLATLIVFGPERLPELATQLGRTLGKLRRGLDEVKKDLEISEIDSLAKTTRQAAQIVRNPKLLASSLLDTEEHADKTK